MYLEESIISLLWHQGFCILSSLPLYFNKKLRAKLNHISPIFLFFWFMAFIFSFFYVLLVLIFLLNLLWNSYIWNFWNESNTHIQFSSVQFSHSVVSNSLRPHESQHARPPCPSPTPRVHSESGPSSPWCHPAISSSVVPFSSCPQSLPASKSSPMSQLFTWGGHSTGVSALASFLPKKYPGWSPLEWTGRIPLQSKGLSGVFSNTTV